MEPTLPLTIWVPEFHDQMIDEAKANLTQDTVNQELLKRDWVTEGLADEIASNAPKSKDIDKETGTRDLQSFKDACKKMFLVGRQFASPKQLEQAAKFFLD